jgi:cytochrome c-type biogenesis protein
MIADAVEQVQAWWYPALAFAAGAISFASPCVLPLVPGYVSFVSGGGEPNQAARRRAVPILLFILGFSVVFTVVFGLSASALSRAVRSQTGQRVAGGFILLFGVFMILYAFRARIPWLYREGRPLLTRMRPGPAGAFPLGMAFAIGWTPCIGPVLGAMLNFAAAQGSTSRSLLLMLFYSLGLGVPFMLVGLGVGRLLGAARFFARNYHWIAGVSGAAMILIGVLLLSGRWTRLIAPLFRFGSNLNLPI